MADHLWFIPAAGGAARGTWTGAPGPGPQTNFDPTFINVQWMFMAASAFGAPPILAPIEATVVNEVLPPASPMGLLSSYASFRWVSIKPSVGGNLEVGTVFSRLLGTWAAPGNDNPPPAGSLWNTVECWCKYRINNPAVFTKITMNMNGLVQPFPLPITLGDWLPFTAAGVWREAYVKYAGPWDGFSDENLRATISFDGPTVPLGAGGLSQVDIEWFAVRLSDETTF
jgi:hypothetical protein